MTFLFAFLIALIGGIILFWLDRKIGIKLYRPWYNISHKDPLPSEEIKGFLIRRPFRVRFIHAVVLTAIEVTLSVFFLKATNPLEDLLYGVPVLLGLMVGFYLAPLFIKIVPKQIENAIDYIEKVEKGQTDVKKDFVKGAIKSGKAINDLMKDKETKPEKKSEKPKPEEKKKEEPKKENPEKSSSKDKDESDKDWRKGIDDFLKK